MKLLLLLPLLLGPLLLVYLAVTVSSGRMAWGPDYTVAELRARLAAQPATLVGRTVVVRGMVAPCPWWGGAARLRLCADEQLILVPGPSDAAAEPLPLRRMATSTALAFLRGLPILRALPAPPRPVPVFTPSRFRVRLQSLAAQSCGGRYAALLLDAAPVASKEL